MNNTSLSVSDTLSNFHDQLANAARMIGRSKARQAIFTAVYTGQKQVKTISEITKLTKLSQKHVLTEGHKIAGLLFEKVPLGYRKKKELAPHYNKILALAKDKRKLERLPTKISPKVHIGKHEIVVAFPSEAQKAIQITIDDIDSFERVRGMTARATNPIAEAEIKEAFKKTIGEKGVFKDWGGEGSDLYTTQVILSGKRIATAIAFKGRGTKGKLVPSKMGKNGDQINRLFDEPAQLYLVVYCGQIEPSIVAQMRAMAIVKALSGQQIYYGIIDANDLGRLTVAYPNKFLFKPKERMGEKGLSQE